MSSLLSVVDAVSMLPVTGWESIVYLALPALYIYMATTEQDIIVGPEQHYVFCDPYLFLFIRENEITNAYH